MQFLQDDPIHPGEILREEFLAEYQLSVAGVASALGVNAGRLADVIAGKAAVDADLALRLSRYFSNSAEFWLNLQRGYDLAVALKHAEGLDAIRPVHAA
ncbi:MAG: XRE family transcriptional regulator [Hoeflea sp. BRH_c9]|nr:MAG: XRE family transcriptional regulator [Hoeflea sp. BRH_c9]